MDNHQSEFLPPKFQDTTLLFCYGCHDTEHELIPGESHIGIECRDCGQTYCESCTEERSGCGIVDPYDRFVCNRCHASSGAILCLCYGCGDKSYELIPGESHIGIECRDCGQTYCESCTEERSGHGIFDPHDRFVCNRCHTSSTL
jgi:hypothetical protein